MSRGSITLGLAVSVAVVAAATALALPGDLDPSFGAGGFVVSDASSAPDDRVHDVIVQSDGKIVAIGFAQGRPEELVAARYHEGGTLDATFGSGGTVALDIVPFGQGFVRRASLQADGKVVAAGGTSNADFVVVRLLPGGSLDPSFDGDGVVETDFGSFGSFSFDSGAAVAVEPDGKIVVAGRASVPFPNPWVSGFALARYHSNGTLDISFDGDGRLLDAVGPMAAASDLAILPDGRIVVAGHAGTPGFDRQFVIRRYSATGVPAGTSYVTFDGSAEASAMALTVDGRIVVAGRTSNAFAVARLTSDGTLDGSFDGDGKLTTEIGPGLSAVALDVVVDASGKIVAGGATTTTGAQDFALARYTTDGSLDPSFGGDGIVTTGFDAGTFERLGGVALAADGDIVAAGWTGAGCGASGCAFNFGLARYDGDPPDIEVNVDIKPGSDENAVTPDKGTIPVGVLSTAVFDATSVDPSNVCFGDADVLSERDCTEEHDRGHVEDIDSDGRADLVLHFTAAESGIDLGDVSACLTGRTYAGVAIRGCDLIRTH